jgi:PAS domain S-box-containing protein
VAGSNAVAIERRYLASTRMSVFQLGSVAEWLRAGLSARGVTVATVDSVAELPVAAEVVIVGEATIERVLAARLRCPEAFLIGHCQPTPNSTALVAVAQAGLDELLVEPIPVEHQPYRLALIRDALHRRPHNLMTMSAVGAAVTFRQALPSGEIEYISPSAARLGFDLAELVGDSTKWRALLHPDEVDEIDRRRMLAAGGEPQTFAHWLRDRTGEFRRVRIDLFQVNHGLVGSFVDITAERALESSLSQIGYDWRATLDSIPIAVVLVDPRRRVVRVNAAARSIFDVSYRELIGVELESFAAWQPWATALTLIDRVLAGADRVREVTPVDDRGRSWDLSADVLRSTHGPERRVIVLARDVTDDLRMRRSVEFNERMASLGSVVAGVAHEVRNPLFGISAIADALEIKFSDAGQTLPHLGMLRTVVARLTRLMNELLTLGSSAQLDSIPCSMVEVITDARHACQLLATQAGVEIVIDAPEVPMLAMIDRSRMVQVFQNLIDNAIQHAPRGSQVEVRIGHSECGRSVRTSVRDHGPGFGEHRKRAVEPFFSRRKDGIGLGLAIVAQLVERHGGLFTLADAPGGGAWVTVDVPIAGGI